MDKKFILVSFIALTFVLQLSAQSTDEAFEYSDLQTYNQAVENINMKNYTEGVDAMLKLSSKGYIEAKHALGILYQKGFGVDEDIDKAIDFYKQAAEEGHVVSQFNLGLIYWKGLGVDQSNADAEKYWTLAAENGLDIAQFNLATLYYTDESELKDEEKAIFWYKMAADQNYKKALDVLAEIDGEKPKSVASSKAVVDKPKKKTTVVKAEPKKATNNVVTDKGKLVFGETTQSTDVFVFTEGQQKVPLTTLYNSAPVKVVNRNKNDYEVIIADGFSVWVFSRFVSQSGSIAYINSTKVRIRSKPSTFNDSVILGYFEKNEQIKIINERNGWLEIKRLNQPKTAWVSSDKLKMYSSHVPLSWLQKWDKY